MERLKKIAFWDRIIFSSYLALFFLVPLILSPWNYELFEFSKILIVYLAALIIAFSWSVKMILSGKIIFKKTFLDFPLVLFLLSQLISTVFSIDRQTSLFGYYSRFHGGLLSTISYLVLYWGLVANLDKGKVEKLIKAILVSGILVSFYAIAEHFGIDKNLWVQDVQNRVFSTLGQPNWLAAYLNVLIFLALFLGLKKENQKPLFYLSSTVIFYLALLYTKSRSGFIGFIFPLALFLITSILFYKKKAREKNKKVIIITLFFFFSSLLIGTPFTPGAEQLFSKKHAPKVVETAELKITPSSEIRKIVWRGALDLWKKAPFFGTGAETFAYSYYWTRPKEHNLTSEWDFLYNKAHNEYLNFLANNGLFGLTAYLLIPWFFFKYVFKKLKAKWEKQELALGISFGYLTIIITNFFGFSVVPIALFFFLLPGIISLDKIPVLKEKKELAKKEKAGLFLVGFLALFLFSKIIAYWLADYYFNQGDQFEKALFLDTGLKKLNQAIKLNPCEPLFYSKRAVILAKSASFLSQNGQMIEAAEFIQPAINDSQKALEISPYQINFYKNQAKVFYYLGFYQVDYLEKALETLLKAEVLAPTDAKIPYNIALIYQTLDQNQLAEEYFQKTLQLKPDYREAEKGLEKISL